MNFHTMTSAGPFLQVSMQYLGGDGNSQRTLIRITTEGGQPFEKKNGDPLGETMEFVVVGELELDDLSTGFANLTS